MTSGLLGGAFDPPHVGHVALARAAVEHFGLDELVVLVVADPGHKGVDAPAEARLALAEVAFAGLARGAPRPVRADDRLAARRRLGRPDLPRRRRPVRRLPDVEGAGRRARARTARRRDPSRLPASGSRRCSRACVAPSGSLLRHRAARGLLDGDPGARRPAVSRSTASSRRASHALIAERRLYVR